MLLFEWEAREQYLWLLARGRPLLPARRPPNRPPQRSATAQPQTMPSKRPSRTTVLHPLPMELVAPCVGVFAWDGPGQNRIAPSAAAAKRSGRRCLARPVPRAPPSVASRSLACSCIDGRRRSDGRCGQQRPQRAQQLLSPRWRPAERPLGAATPAAAAVSDGAPSDEANGAATAALGTQVDQAMGRTARSRGVGPFERNVGTFSLTPAALSFVCASMLQLDRHPLARTGSLPPSLPPDSLTARSHSCVSPGSPSPPSGKAACAIALR